MESKKYVKVRFLDENGEPKGREYTYSGDESMRVGDYVYAMTMRGEQKVIITQVDVQEEEVASFIDKIKAVFGTPVEGQ